MRMSLVLVVAACGGASPPAPVATPGPIVGELWDRGTFVTIVKDAEDPAIEETFEIRKLVDGYQISIDWKRPSPVGDRGFGKIVMTTDAAFSPIAGEMTSKLVVVNREEVTRSTMRRGTGDLLAAEVIAADGTKSSTAATQRVDWYIGGTVTTFLAGACWIDPATPLQPTVYPGKVVDLSKALPLPLPDTARQVAVRILEYPDTKRRVVIACEGDKLAGETTRGTTIVRRGDLELARALIAFDP